MGSRIFAVALLAVGLLCLLAWPILGFLTSCGSYSGWNDFLPGATIVVGVTALLVGGALLAFPPSAPPNE